MTEFRMPSLGADMEAGIIVEWLVEPGATVQRGDVIVLVETEKGIIDVEIWHNATIDSIVVPAGEEVAVGTVIAELSDATTPTSAPSRPRITPRARAIAAELGVDPADLAAGGAVTEAAVRRAASRTKRAPPTDPAQAMRRAIARSMTRAKQEIPHYYVATTIDMTDPLEWLQERNSKGSVAARIVPAALLFKATALAARDFPAMNGRFLDGEFHEDPAVNLGIAISLRTGGLVAPALNDCAVLELDDLMAALTDLVKRARNGRLRNSELSSATLTVTNLGERGVEQGFGVIIPPQVAIVCFGSIVTKPWVVDGGLAVRSLVIASLSADHRVSDGHEGGRFLETIAAYLHKPEQL